MDPLYSYSTKLRMTTTYARDSFDPVDNSNCPDEYPLYEGSVRNLNSKTFVWFYRRSIPGQPHIFLCTCQEALDLGMDPESCHSHLKATRYPPNKPATTSAKPAAKPAGQFTAKPAVQPIPLATPLPVGQQQLPPVQSLPSYKAEPAKQFSNKRSVDDVDKQSRSDLHFNTLNTNITNLTQQLVAMDSKRGALSTVTENNIAALYDLNQEMKNQQKTLMDFRQTLLDSIDKIHDMVIELKSLHSSNAVKTFELKKPEVKRRKVLEIDEPDPIDDSGEDLLDKDFQKKEFNKLKK